MIRSRRNIGLICFTAVAAGWLVLVGILASRFSLPSSDGILYSLPFASARHPFDLGIPFLDGFRDYGTTWGHHWPGAMWIRGALFSVLPFSRDADVIVLSLFQCLSATAAAAAVRACTGKLWIAAAVWILLLSDRLLLLACSGNRFESVAVAAVVCWFSLVFAQSRALPPLGKWGARIAAFLSPTLHPYAVVMGAMIAVYDLLDCRRQSLPARESFIRLGCFLLGSAATVSWFAFQPAALAQFAANAALQNTFYQNWNTVILGLQNYRLGGGLLLWSTGLIAGAALGGGWVRLPGTQARADAFRFLAPALLVAVIAIHTLIRCENFTYLAFGTPFAAILLALFVNGLGVKESIEASVVRKPLRWFPLALFTSVFLTHVAILPFRTLQFYRAGCPDLKAEISSFLGTLPPDASVYIPHLMWPAAGQAKDRKIRWFTLPLASPAGVRAEYEEIAYSRARPGDFLVIDNLAAAGGDRFGLHPTFPVLPPDPARWVPVKTKTLMMPGSVPWGLDLTAYRFTGSDR